MSALEKHFSVKEIANLWGLSRNTITRIFSHEAGVLKHGRAETMHKRKYFQLRIPESVLIRVYNKMGRSKGE
jgi:Fic family protein